MAHLLRLCNFSLEISVFGRGFLSDEYTHKESTQPPVVEQGSPNPGMEGSVMVFRYPNIEACWAR